MDRTECRIHKLVGDVAAFAHGRVLLVRYVDVSAYDGQRGWFLPDDYLAFGEDPSHAARRILREQAGLQAQGIHLSHVESFGGERSAWHLVFHHWTELDEVPEFAPGANVAEARWFPLDDLPEADQVAHGGWALDILGDVAPSRARGAGERGNPSIALVPCPDAP